VLNTFDRYLLKRYLTTFVIMFVSTYGLFVVIDGFTNLDDFQDKSSTVVELLISMGKYYAYWASDFFDLVGASLSVMTAVIVMGLLLYHRELQPILAAGIPTYRLARPLIVGVIITNLLLIANTELVIPKVSFYLQSSRGDGLSRGKSVEPVQDYELHINIDGDRIFADDQSITQGRFILSAPFLVRELTTLSCEKAVYYPKSSHPAGWLLKNVRPKYDDLKLTDLGRENLLKLKGREDLFLTTDVTFAQIYSKGGNYLFDTTPELIERVNSPALSQTTIRRQILHLHNRLARPLQSICAVMLAIPFVIRKESRSLIAGMALASGVLVSMMALQQLSNFLASAMVITPDFAIFVPVLVGGGMAAWYSQDVLT
jgi:lipopolysaccharide export system permease protein